MTQCTRIMISDMSAAQEHDEITLWLSHEIRSATGADLLARLEAQHRQLQIQILKLRPLPERRRTVRKLDSIFFGFTA